MKFGLDLKQQIVEGWESGYIGYDDLKELIKKISSEMEKETKKKREEDFFLLLEDELEKVNRFYLEKVKEFENEVERLEATAARRQAKKKIKRRSR